MLCCVLCPPSVRKHELTTLLAFGIADSQAKLNQESWSIGFGALAASVGSDLQLEYTFVLRTSHRRPNRRLDAAEATELPSPCHMPVSFVHFVSADHHKARAVGLALSAIPKITEARP